MTPRFRFGPVTEADFEDLLALRLDTMRASLERLGRFDPGRARERFRHTFRPTDTRRIVVGGIHAGCVAFWAEPPDAMRVEHFYLAPAFQRLGLGGAVLQALVDEAPRATLRFRVGALRGSDANRFYARHGFVPVAETEWDIEHERHHTPPRD